jgi:hypothetical protein
MIDIGLLGIIAGILIGTFAALVVVFIINVIAEVMREPR